MHWSKICLFFVAGAASTVSAASAWGFQDATLSIKAKAGKGTEETLNSQSPLSKAVSFGPSDSLKIILTATEGKKGKKPHQAFLTVAEPSSGLEESYLLNVKENGKGTVTITQKDIPRSLLVSKAPLAAYLTIASFGSSTPFRSKAFDLSITPDPTISQADAEPPLRYGQKPEINHQFRADPRSPPAIITLFFTALVLATLPALFGTWLFLGANVSHISQALGAAPLAHVLFIGSIFAMEGAFFLYYTHWNLFQLLPVATVLGAITFVTGGRALTEVQERRLAGQR